MYLMLTNLIKTVIVNQICDLVYLFVFNKNIFSQINTLGHEVLCIHACVYYY
jgi:hypothetical protein